MSDPVVTYHNSVRSFGHEQLSRYPAYTRVREAMSDLANQAGRDEKCTLRLGDFLEAVRDMALTGPFGDNCPECEKACAQHPRKPDDGPCMCGYQAAFPHRVEREDDWLTCHYRCPAGHKWTCGYSVDIVNWL